MIHLAYPTIVDGAVETGRACTGEPDPHAVQLSALINQHNEPSEPELCERCGWILSRWIGSVKFHRDNYLPPG